MTDIEVPTLCSKCLGGNDTNTIRMIKQPEGETCKMCTRPFTVFRWQSANTSSKRSSKTIICNVCSKARNCCQSCMLDLDFLIPLEIRDTALKMAKLDHLIQAPSGSRSSEVKALIADKQESKFSTDDTIHNNQKAQEILKKLAESINGQKADTKAIKPTKVKDADTTTIPNNVAKLIRKLPFNGTIDIPESPITSFFVFGIPEDLPQYVLTDHFSQFGKLKSISIVHKAKCGFLTYASRKSAEAFATSVQTNNKTTAAIVILNGNTPVRVAWGETKSIGTTSSEHKKIALVVDKVMQQLAEKDRKQQRPKRKAGGSAGKATGEHDKGENRGSKKKKYEAASKDFEL